MMEYVFYFAGKYYSVFATTYDEACKSFARFYGRESLGLAYVTTVKPA